VSTGRTNTPEALNDVGANDDDRTMPLGMGEVADEFAGLDPLSGGETRRRFNTGSLVIVAVIVIACGGLWFMRTLTTVRASSGGDTSIEQTVEKFIKNLRGDETGSVRTSPNLLTGSDRGVLEVLNQTYTERQVPLSDVARNPFIIYDEIGGPAVPADNSGSKTLADRRIAIERAAAKLRLKSVIMGSQPLANISGKIVRVGEEMVSEPDNVPFRIIEITSDFVILEGIDAALNLKVEINLPLKRDLPK
jgi:hypothetical protein